MRAFITDILKLLQAPSASEAVKEATYHRIVSKYTQWNIEEKKHFITALSSSHNISAASAQLHAKTLSTALQHPDENLRGVAQLRQHLIPAYRQVFLALGRQPQGIKVLVNLRTDILDIYQQYTEKLEELSRSPSQTLEGTISEKPKQLGLEAQFASNSEQHDKVKTEDALQILHRERERIEFMSSELQELLSIWFMQSMFRLERVTWESSCALLQRISAMEAVHRISTWQELKQRVGNYRRCFVLSHMCMPKEPIVILHVGLAPRIPATLQELHNHPVPVAPVNRVWDRKDVVDSDHEDDEEDENIDEMKSAIFYSISSPHRGLSGIELGQTMIRTAVKELKMEFEDLSLFSTLSNVTGFRDWLLTMLNRQLHATVQNRLSLGGPPPIGTPANVECVDTELSGAAVQSVLEAKDLSYLRCHWGQSLSLKDCLLQLRCWLEEQFLPSHATPQAMLSSVDFATGDYPVADAAKSKIPPEFKLPSLSGLDRAGEMGPDHQEEARRVEEVLKPLLMQLCARYLCRVKHRGMAMDRVANFHLKNGAEIWRINWMGDPSERGMELSYGFMVNYRYHPEQMDHNRKRYVEQQEIALSGTVQGLLDGSPQLN